MNVLFHFIAKLAERPALPVEKKIVKLFWKNKLFLKKTHECSQNISARSIQPFGRL